KDCRSEADKYLAAVTLCNDYARDLLPVLFHRGCPRTLHCKGRAHASGVFATSTRSQAGTKMKRKGETYMNRSDTRIFQHAVFGMILACLAFAASGAAQDTSSTSSYLSGPATVTTEVKRAEIVYV